MAVLIRAMFATAVASYAIFLLLFSPSRAALIVGFLGLFVSGGLFVDFEKASAFAMLYGWIVCVYGLFTPSAEVLVHGSVGVLIIVGLGKAESWLDRFHRSECPTKSDPPSDGDGRVEGMNEDNGNLDKLKYRLELQKFMWERETFRKTNNLINRNIGVVVTAIVSFAAVAVSYLQLTISSNNARDQMALERLKNDRQFYFEVARFLLDHQQEMTARDNSKVAYLRNVVVSTFPKEVAIQVSSRMRDTASTPDVRKVWEEALTYLKANAANP
jgi:hypothetical protein